MSYGFRPRAKGKPTARKAAGAMNKTEAAYAAHLESQKQMGLIVDYAYEGVTLKLAADTRYTPDFLVLSRDYIVEFHEVKAGMKVKTNGTWIGEWKPLMMDDAHVKIKVAAEKWPMFLFLLKYSAGAGTGDWRTKEIIP